MDQNCIRGAPNGDTFKTANIVSRNIIRLKWPRSQNPNVTDTSFSNKIMDSAQLTDYEKSGNSSTSVIHLHVAS